MTLWAVLAKAPKALRVYFVAQLVNTILLETAYGRVGTAMYASLYTAGFAIIFCAMVEIVWEAVRSWPVLAVAGVLSGLILLMASRSVPHWNEAVVVIMLEATLLVFCTCALAFRVPFMADKSKRVHTALVLLWFSLAVFDFCLAARVPMTDFLNQWAPTWALVSTMFYLGYQLRSEPMETA